MAVQILLSVCCTAALFLAFWSIGTFLLARFKCRTGETLLDACAGAALGFGVVGNCVMTLCFIHRATPTALRALVAIILIVSVPYAWANRTVLSCGIRSFARAFRAAHPLVSAAFCALLAGYCLRGLVPPTDFDGLMYHLASAKLYLSHSGFYHVYFNPQADFPMLTEMNFMLGLALGNDIICKTLSFALGVVVLGLIAVLCKRLRAGPAQAMGACVIFMTFTNTIANMSNCDVDFPMAAWTVTAVLFMERFCETGERRFSVCAGIFSGMAMQTKIFGVFVLPMLLFIALTTMSKRGAKKTVAGLTTVFIPALALALPWYAKSFAHTGSILSISHATIVGQNLSNPFGVVTNSPLAYWLLNTVGRLLSAPWAFSLFPRLHQADSFGPLIIAVLPFIVFIKVPRNARSLLVYAGIFMAEILAMELWFIQGGASIRYCVFVMMLCAPLIVRTLAGLHEYPGIRRALSVMVVIMAVLGIALFAKRYYKDWKAIALNQPRDAYYSSVLPEYRVIRAMNSLQDGATVMPVYNYANYLIDIPYVAAYRAYSSAYEALADFREKNIRYIFANNNFDTLSNEDPFPQIKNKRVVAAANGFYLFRVEW